MRGGVVLRSGPRRTRRPVRRRGSPNVSLATTDFVGKHSSYELRRTLQRRTYRIKTCYRQRLRNVPNIGGLVTALFTVSVKGKVSRASFAGFDAGAANCVKQTLTSTKFSKVTEPLRVRMTFKFRPHWGFSAPKGQRDDRDVLGAFAVEPPRDRCVKRTRFVLGGAHLAAVRRCYTPMAKRSARMTALFDVDAAGVVLATRMHGIADGEFPDCVADALRDVKLAKGAARRVACTIGFESPGANRTIDSSVRLDVGRGDVMVGRFKASESMDLTHPVPGAKDGTSKFLGLLRLSRWEQQYIDERGLPLAGRENLAIHAHPAIDAAALTKVLGLARQVRFAPLYYTRAVGTSDMWQAVNPIGTPTWMCDGARGATTVTVTPTTLTVTGAGRKIHSVVRSSDGALAKLGTILSKMQTVAGVDLDIVVATGVTYREILNVLEIVVRAGFFDTRIVAPSDL